MTAKQFDQVRIDSEKGLELEQDFYKLLGVLSDMYNDCETFDFELFEGATLKALEIIKKKNE